MSAKVEFRFRFPTGPGGDLGPALRFTHWLPIGEDEGIAFELDGLTYRYWIGADCQDHCGQSLPADFTSFLEVTARYMYVTVAGYVAPDDIMRLHEVIRQETNRSIQNLSTKHGNLPIDPYEELCRRVYETAVTGFNRIIAYCQAVKGQYWLEEWNIDSRNILREFHLLAAQIRFAALEWQPWLPPTNNTFVMGRTAQPERCVSHEDWPLIQEFLNGKSRPDLVGTLLANAERHHSRGLARAAPVEAITALDFCIHQFANRCRQSFDWFYRDEDRFGVDSLQSHVKHLGVTCTVSYLLPMIFTPEQVSSMTLKSVQEAIAERNRVVHEGKRHVDIAKLGTWLSAIRAICLFLGSLIQEARSLDTDVSE